MTTTQTIVLTPFDLDPNFEGVSVLVDVRTMKCDTAQSLELCGIHLGKLKTERRRLDAQLKRLTDSLKPPREVMQTMHAEACRRSGFRPKPKDLDDDAIEILSARMVTEENRQRSLERARVRKAQAEADRVAKENQDRELEEMRARAESEEVTRKQSKAIHQAADQLADEPEPVGTVTSVAATRKASTGTVGRREYPYGVVVDPAAFLAWILEEVDDRWEYLELNKSKFFENGHVRKTLNADAKDLGELFAIPGCERRVRTGYSG